jgi:drug/metabolite transporter, DME family
MPRKLLIGYGLVLLAATLWGTLGIFYHELIQNYRLSPFSIVFWRALIAACLLWITLGLFKRSQLKISQKDWGLFLALGSIGIAGFYIVYIFAISLSGLGIAAVLLYTAPVWVTIYSVFVLKESLDKQKTFALLLAITGIVLVGHFYDFPAMRINLPGLLAGLGAGFGYSAYILMNKFAVQRNYSPWAINAYSLAMGAIFLGLLQSPTEQRSILQAPGALLWLGILGVIPTLGGGVAFNAGLNFLPASNASIVATIEPVIASIFGWIIFNETMDYYQIIGGGLIISSVIVLQIPAIIARHDPEKLSSRN